MLFSIFLALDPNLNVDMLYSNYWSVGVIQRSTMVLEFPPSAVLLKQIKTN